MTHRGASLMRGQWFDPCSFVLDVVLGQTPEHRGFLCAGVSGCEYRKANSSEGPFTAFISPSLNPNLPHCQLFLLKVIKSGGMMADH